jgi:hypothetical protein
VGPRLFDKSFEFGFPCHVSCSLDPGQPEESKQSNSACG